MYRRTDEWNVYLLGASHAMIDDQEGGVRSDLKVLVDIDGNRFGMGKSAIQC